MQLWQYCLLVTARSLYMFRTLPATIIRSNKNCSNSHWCMSWVGMMYIQQGRPRSVAYCTVQWATDLGRPCWLYIIPTHDMRQWLLLQFLVLLMMRPKHVG
jgi:hypothetical protein